MMIRTMITPIMGAIPPIPLSPSSLLATGAAFVLMINDMSKLLMQRITH